MRVARRLLNAIAALWLLVGVLAAWQRGYLIRPPADCAQGATVALAVADGPLNYLGANPRLVKCQPQVPRRVPGVP